MKYNHTIVIMALASKLGIAYSSGKMFGPHETITTTIQKNLSKIINQNDSKLETNSTNDKNVYLKDIKN